MNPGDSTDDLADDTTPPPTGQQQQQQLPPEALHSALQSTRSENARFRTQNRDLRKLLATVSGIEMREGSPAPDLATIQKQFDSLNAGEKATIRTLKMDLGLERAARTHGVERPSVMKAFLADAGKLKDLDPLAETFEDDISSLIAEELVLAPELRGRQSFPPQGTGAQFRPGPASDQITRSELANMSPTEIDEARRAGKLNAILGRS